nr:hypothetical protein [Delftia acidovorans]
MPHTPSRRQLLLASAAACLLGPSGTVSAQGAAPLKLVITFPPGAAPTSPPAYCSRAWARWPGER